MLGSEPVSEAYKVLQHITYVMHDNTAWRWLFQGCHDGNVPIMGLTPEEPPTGCYAERAEDPGSIYTEILWQYYCHRVSLTPL